MPLYDMEPPNDDFNHPDSFCLLDDIRFSTGDFAGRHISDDLKWVPSPGDTLRPVLWDAVLLSRLLLDDEKLIQDLGNLARDGWPSVGTMAARGSVSRVSKTLVAKMVEAENEAAEKFFGDCPTYGGSFRIWDGIEDWQEGKRFDIDRMTAVRIGLSLERAATIIFSWCCCTFHYCREMWGGAAYVAPLDFSAAEPDINTLPLAIGGTEYRKPKHKQTAEEKRAEYLATLTPEQRAAEIRSQKNQEIIRQLMRKGKIDEQTLIDLSM